MGDVFYYDALFTARRVLVTTAQRRNCPEACVRRAGRCKEELLLSAEVASGPTVRICIRLKRA